MRQSVGMRSPRGKFRAWGLTVAAVVMSMVANAQTTGDQGSSGITTATNDVKGYFDVGVNLMYAIGAILGLVGAVKV